MDSALGEMLALLATETIIPGLQESPGRAVLVGELVLNLTRAGRINQGLKGTCAAACVESWLAEAMPDEYARLIAGLAAGDGRVLLRSGEILARNEQTLVWNTKEARRSPVSRLFQAACMALAYVELDYCNIRDGHFNTAGEDAGYGLKLEAFDRLLELITGQRWDMLSDLHTKLLKMLGMVGSSLPTIQDDGADIIRRSLAEGQPLFVTLNLKGARWDGELIESGVHITHKVRLVAVTADRVIFDDPLDPEEPWFDHVDTVLINDDGRASMSMAALIARTVELSYRPHFYVAEE